MTPDQIRELVVSRDRMRRLSPDLLSWSQAFRYEAGSHLDFDRFPFQVELYRAFGDRDLQSVDVMKSAQCGISAAAVSLTLYAGDVWGASVLYILSTGDDAEDFSDTRVRPAIEGSGYLRGRVSSTDNQGLKRIGDAFLYFRGSVSERKALSIPADVLVLDEYDRLDQRNVPLLRKRLGSPSSLHLERRFSNPGYPEFGIHALYLHSDRRSWLIRCPGCRCETPIGYEETEDRNHFVDEERRARVCGRCHREFSRATIAGGRWVAARPSVDARGYHISKLIVPDQSIEDLIVEHARTDEDSVKAHHNFDLGLPYASRGGSLSEALVLACRRDWALKGSYAGKDWVTAGVDVGRVLHVRISAWLPSGRAVPLHIGEIADFEELALIWNRYGVNLGLIDERPEERAARAFAETFRGRCYLVRWSGSSQRDPVVIDQDRMLVIARRTAACDRTVAAFTEQMRLLPRDVPPHYLRQVTAPHRVTETSASGQKVARYVSERDDHFFFAECYDLLAKEARGGPAAEGGSSGPAPANGPMNRSLWGPPLGSSNRRSRWQSFPPDQRRTIWRREI